jgi:hypothetical protein
MSPAVDYGKLRGEGGAVADHPADGLHIARLERAVLQDTKRGQQVLTEWSDPDNVMWTSWNRFDPDQFGMPRTQKLLDGLGVDRAKLTDDDALSQALADVEGGTYQVRTQSRKAERRLGDEADKWFTDTFVEQTVSGRQQALTDIPADTTGLREPAAQGATAKPASDFDDDDIPF